MNYIDLKKTFVGFQIYNIYSNLKRIVNGIRSKIVCTNHSQIMFNECELIVLNITVVLKLDWQ